MNGVVFVLRGTGKGRIALWLGTLVGYTVISASTDLTGALGHLPSNAWDIVFLVLSYHPTTLLWIPFYLFLTSRNLSNEWESLVVTRFPHRLTWWAADIEALGVAAFALTLLTSAIGIMAGPLVGRLSWQWSGLARSPWAILHAIPHLSPLVATLYSVGLLTLGLWALGILNHALSLWWQSEWLAALTVVVAELLPSVFLGNGRMTRWFPGSQFVFATHITDASGHTWAIAYSTVGWTLAYSLALIIAGTGFGAIRSLYVAWDRTPDNGP
jgi:hypothetical protein